MPNAQQRAQEPETSSLLRAGLPHGTATEYRRKEEGATPSGPSGTPKHPEPLGRGNTRLSLVAPI